MVNYLLGVKFEEEEWYEITEEATARDQSQSQTSEITMYEVFPVKSNMSLTIIDTPGYGDTRGLEKDLEVAENLSALFQSNDGVREIDADHKNQPVHFLFNNRQADDRHTGERHVRAQRDAWFDSMEETKKFLQSLDKKNRRSLELTSGVLMERIQFEASICNLQLRIQEMEQKKAEKLQIQEAIRQNKKKIEDCENFTIQVKKTVKEKVTIEGTSWKHRKATTCTVCEENCHEFDCWWVSNPSKCKVMKNGYCTVCTGKCHHSKHVKENKKYIISTSSVTMEFNNINKEYKKVQAQTKRFSVVMDDLDQDLMEIETQKEKLLFSAYKAVKDLSQNALKPDSAFTLQHLDFFIPRVREAGKVNWVQELEEMRRAAEAEETNKDALSYLKAGMEKLGLVFGGQ
ncbi:hypothetical protein cypCar_00037017 [Cyprinus carpio]|nr:hypothetical protein cypCar_00037017 [Cyprinus carpio]